MLSGAHPHGQKRIQPNKPVMNHGFWQTLPCSRTGVRPSGHAMMEHMDMGKSTATKSPMRKQTSTLLLQVEVSIVRMPHQARIGEREPEPLSPTPTSTSRHVIHSIS